MSHVLFLLQPFWFAFACTWNRANYHWSQDGCLCQHYKSLHCTIPFCYAYTQYLQQSSRFSRPGPILKWRPVTQASLPPCHQSNLTSIIWQSSFCSHCSQVPHWQLAWKNVPGFASLLGDGDGTGTRPSGPSGSTAFAVTSSSGSDSMSANWSCRASKPNWLRVELLAWLT